jgi:hypothetical protein
VTTQQIIELVAAVALIVLGVLQYRRRSAEGERYGSQSAVLLFVAAALVLVHALGLLEYRPSPSELGQ